VRGKGWLAFVWLVLAAAVVGTLLWLSILNRRPARVKTTRLERAPVSQSLVLRGRLQRRVGVDVRPAVAGWALGDMPEIGRHVKEGQRLLSLRADPMFVAQVSEALAQRREARQELRRLSRVAVRSPTAGRLLRWDIEPGSRVAEGQRLATVSVGSDTAGAGTEHVVPAPEAGRTLPFLVSPGDRVSAGDDVPLLFIVPDREPEDSEHSAAATAPIGRLLQANAQLERLALAASRPYPDEQLSLDRAFVVAPLAGEVTWRALSLVRGSPVSPEQRILTLASSERIVVANLHEVDYPSLLPGQPVEAAFDAFPKTSHPARLLSKSQTPAVSVFDQYSEYSAVFSLSDPPSRLIDGMSCNMTVTVASRPDAESLPISALVRGDAPPAVWVEREQGFELLPVRIGLVGDMRVEILGDLAPDDEVALEPEKLPDHVRAVRR